MKIKFVDKFLHDKREQSRLKRLHNKSNKRRHVSRTSFGIYHSEILDALHDGAVRIINKRHFSTAILIPETFSIIDSPIETIRTIKSLANIARSGRKIRRVQFNHSNLQKVDLAAECVLDYTAIEFRNEHEYKGKRPRIEGVLPTDKNLDRFIRAIGLIKHLDITHEFLSKEEERNLQIFTIKNKKTAIKENLFGPDFKEIVVRDFVDHINGCLMFNGRLLSDFGKKKLSEYTGEIIANAEDHSGSDDWSIAGYLDNESKDHLCEIVIFNFGKTFFDSFKLLDSDHYARQQIEPYVFEHRRKSLFDTHWTEEALTTLVSLQGHISSKNLTSTDTRGQGTVEMINFFQQVYEECSTSTGNHAQMALLSGSTHILFDGTYTMETDIHGRDVIAFNRENTLSERPDKQFVKALNNCYFPGTIISIRFPLKPDYSSMVKTNEQ